MFTWGDAAWRRGRQRRPQRPKNRGRGHGGFTMAAARGALAIRRRRRAARAQTSPGIPVARFQNICISREAGAGASIIARLVGQRLGWKVYDQELIEAIAHRMGQPIDEIQALDELAPSMVQDWLLPLREEYYAPQEAYLDHLAKLIEAIGRAGDSILVGRGAGFMLPRETTLSLRVIAPLKVRAIRLAERMGVSIRTARRLPGTWTGAGLNSIAPCIEPTRMTRTTSTWFSTRVAWVYRSRPYHRPRHRGRASGRRDG